MRGAWLLALTVGCSNGSAFHPLSKVGGKVGLGGPPAGEPGDDRGAPPDGQGSDQVVGDDDGTDEPAWVNGAYLTCDWRQAVSETAAEVACAARDAATGEPLVADAGALWSVAFADGSEVDAATSAAGELVTAAFVLESHLLPDLAVGVAMASHELEAPLIEALPGFSDPADLAGCLRASGALTECLLAVGIDVRPAPPAPAPPPPPASPPPPPRTSYGGASFYLGDSGYSCDEVCGPFGGTDDATIAAVGSGGTALACVDVLAAFGTISVFDGQTAAVGLGCYLAASDDGQRVTSPATTHEAKDPGARRVCACQL